MGAAPPRTPEGVVLPPLRGDLLITKQRFEGRTYYVIKDPVSLQYFRLTAEDYYLATLFDGKRTFREVREAFLEMNPHRRLEATTEEIDERLTRFANDLALMHFLSVQGQRLKARFEAIKRHKRARGWFAKAVNVLFFGRMSLFDPDRLFGRLARPLWWFWTRATLWVSVALIAVAAVLFLQHADRAAVLMAHFFSLQNLALVWVATIVIKAIHELGHGLTCKHFGGEVHEVGLMFLVFTPYFFVNVTDSWMMPRRRHRMLVAAAGIYVELILAALATFVWVASQPGLFHQFLYNVIVVASFSTIVFNANPLMRFDGYYIMVDLLEVPNLQTKSRALIGSQLKRLLFGRDYQDPVLERMPLPRKRFWLFYTYAILSFLYGYYIIYNISMFMAPHLAPFGLEGLANWFTGLALFAWVVMPLAAFFKGLNLTRDDWGPGGRSRRLAWIGGAAAAALAGWLALPAELAIGRSIAIEIADPETVRAEVPGIIDEVLVREGDRLPAGGVVARLRNREIDQQYAVAQRRIEMAETMATRALAAERPAEFRQAEGSLVQFRAALEQAERDREHLLLRSQEGGTVLTRELPIRRGQMLRSGDLFCEVAPLDAMRIRVPLSEKQVRYVKQGQRVVVKAAAFPRRQFEGVVAEEPLTAFGHEMPAGLAKTRRGDVPTAIDAQGKEIPTERTYAATVEIDNRAGLLRPGMTGRAKIAAGRFSRAKLVLQSLFDWVSLDFRF